MNKELSLVLLHTVFDIIQMHILPQTHNFIFKMQQITLVKLHEYKKATTKSYLNLPKELK